MGSLLIGESSAPKTCLPSNQGEGNYLSLGGSEEMLLSSKQSIFHPKLQSLH